MSKLRRQPIFRAVGQTHAKWDTFEKPENKAKCMAVIYACLTAIHVSYFLVFKMPTITRARLAYISETWLSY